MILGKNAHRILLCYIALPYFFSKRVKNGGILVDVEKNLYLCMEIFY